MLMLYCCCFLCVFFCSQAMSRRIYPPDPDQTVMEEWAKEVGRKKSEVREDENRV